MERFPETVKLLTVAQQHNQQRLTELRLQEATMLEEKTLLQNRLVEIEQDLTGLTARIKEAQAQIDELDGVKSLVRRQRRPQPPAPSTPSPSDVVVGTREEPSSSIFGSSSVVTVRKTTLASPDKGAWIGRWVNRGRGSRRIWHWTTDIHGEPLDPWGVYTACSRMMLINDWKYGALRRRGPNDLYTGTRCITCLNRKPIEF